MPLLRHALLICMITAFGVSAFAQHDQQQPVSVADGVDSAVQAPAAPEDGGPRNWQVVGVASGLNLREGPSTGSRILLSYANGTIFDNLGCLQAGDRAWCDVQQLGGGPRGYVAADFLRPAVSPQLSS